jgi:hypothetical protein
MSRFYYSIFLFLAAILSSKCSSPDRFTHGQYAQVRDSVQIMASQIAADVSQNGPLAWLRHFEDTSDFFMASDGHLMFPDYDSASAFINHVVVKMISKIELSWSDIRIDPLSPDLAMFAADYTEVLTDSAGKKMPISGPGYFTALAEKTPKGWQLRNAHWSRPTGGQGQ